MYCDSSTEKHLILKYCKVFPKLSESVFDNNVVSKIYQHTNSIKHNIPLNQIITITTGTLVVNIIRPLILNIKLEMNNCLVEVQRQYT